MVTRSALESMKIGTKTADVVSTMAETSKKYGFTLTAPLGHFVGLDLIEGRVAAPRVRWYLIPALLRLFIPGSMTQKALTCSYGDKPIL